MQTRKLTSNLPLNCASRFFIEGPQGQLPAICAGLQTWIKTMNKSEKNFPLTISNSEYVFVNTKIKKILFEYFHIF